ncbi:MAG: M1 family metallopeptidase, partial [Thermodesulfobacteriota bacterium]
MKRLTFSLIFLSIFAYPSISAASRPKKVDVLFHDIFISIDLEEHSLKGRDKIIIRKDRNADVVFFLREASGVDKVTMDGNPLPFHIKDNQQSKELYITLPEKAGTISFEISFQGSFSDISVVKQRTRRGIAFVDDGVMGREGGFLPSSSLWFPQRSEGVSLFKVTVETSTGYEVVAEGEQVKRIDRDARTLTTYETHNPLRGLNIVVGKYRIQREKYKDIDILTYFSSDNQDLSDTYIQKVKGYLELYERLFGPYPFKKFAVVENFLPTGYGMPSFTLLGKEVLKLPFIVDTSLGHEVAHNWWGNSVFSDTGSGNWTEALTTYIADYLYKEQQGKALEYRREMLRKYSSYAKGEEEMALKDFRYPTDPRDRAIGYNKGAMVFHMLRMVVGEKGFFKALQTIYREKAFKVVSYTDFQDTFEKIHNKDLSWFFKQWIEKPGGPALRLGKVVSEKVENGHTVTVEVIQKGRPYILDLPISFETENGKIEKVVRISKEVERVTFSLRSMPVSLKIDPEHHLFRILSKEEMPPLLHNVFANREGLVVLPGEGKGMKGYMKLG